MDGLNIHRVEPKFNASEMLFQQYLAKKNVDTFLRCSDDVIAAHSSVLMNNDFFKEQIENNERNGNERLEINVQQFSTDVMMVIMEYLYRGNARYFREIKREVKEAIKFFFKPNTQKELQVKKEKPDSTSVLPDSNNTSGHLPEVPISPVIKEEPAVWNSSPVKSKKRRINPFSNNLDPQTSAELIATKPADELVEDDSSDDSFVFDLNEVSQTTANKSKKPDKSSENLETTKDDETQLNMVIEPAVKNKEYELVETSLHQDIVNCLLNSENWKSICVICMKRFKDIKKHIKSTQYGHQIVKPYERSKN